MTSRKFYRNVIQVEILSEDPMDGDLNLENINYAITDGDCSGRVTSVVNNEELDGKRAAELLLEQASDPEFFQIDEFGNDIDDDYDY